MADLVAAVDVGGTAMKGAVATPDGALARVEERPTPREQGPEAVIEALVAFAAELAQDAAAVGVAVPGLVDEARGVAVASVNLGWRDLMLRDRLQERLDRRTIVLHDVRAAGLAEQLRGAGRGAGDFLLVPIGTGIAAALFVRGEAYAGGRGFGGELGHVTVDPAGPRCACGKQGCLETIASAAAIARRYSQGGGEAADAKEVGRRAGAGDALARRVLDEALAALAWTLANVVALLDPSRIVIGGGLGEAGEPVLAPLRAALGERTRPLHEPPPLVGAELGREAGCHGAALGAWLALGRTRDELAA